MVVPGLGALVADQPKPTVPVPNRVLTASIRDPMGAVVGAVPGRGAAAPVSVSSRHITPARMYGIPCTRCGSRALRAVAASAPGSCVGAGSLT